MQVVFVTTRLTHVSFLFLYIEVTVMVPYNIILLLLFFRPIVIIIIVPQVQLCCQSIPFWLRATPGPHSKLHEPDGARPMTSSLLFSFARIRFKFPKEVAFPASDWLYWFLYSAFFLLICLQTILYIIQYLRQGYAKHNFKWINVWIMYL